MTTGGTTSAPTEGEGGAGVEAAEDEDDEARFGAGVESDVRATPLVMSRIGLGLADLADAAAEAAVALAVLAVSCE